MNQSERTSDSPATPTPGRYALWRHLAAVLVIGLAFGCFHLASAETRDYGPGFFPNLLCVFAVLLLFAAAGLLFPRAITWLLGLLLRIVEVVLALFSH